MFNDEIWKFKIQDLTPKLEYGIQDSRPDPEVYEVYTFGNSRFKTWPPIFSYSSLYKRRDLTNPLIKEILKEIKLDSEEFKEVLKKL